MNFLSNLFGGNMLANIGKSDPWAGMRNVGDHAPMTFKQRADSVFGNMAAMPEQPQAQFAPVQFGGANQNGNDLSKLVMAMMQRGQ